MFYEINVVNGIVPEHIKDQFKEIITKKYHNEGYEEFIERIDTKEILYRIKFEVEPDSTFLMINIVDYREFEKTR